MFAQNHAAQVLSSQSVFRARKHPNVEVSRIRMQIKIKIQEDSNVIVGFKSELDQIRIRILKDSNKNPPQ